MKWLVTFAALAGAALAGQGLNRDRTEMRKQKMMEDRSTAKKPEKATFAAG